MMTRQLCLFGLTVAVLAFAFHVVAEVPSVKIGKFPQEVAAAHTVDQGLPSNDVRTVHLGRAGQVYAETDKGWAVLKDGAWSKTDAPEGLVDSRVAKDPGGKLIVATPEGLVVRSGGDSQPLVVEDGLGRRWGTSDVRGVAFDSKGQLWFACLAGAACKTADGWKFYTGQDGLPYNDFTVVEAGPNGVVWFGTHKGIVRFDGTEWAYRQGRRWLPNDDVRDIAVDAKGNAWIATADGVGYIGWQMMTLAEKAEVYEDEMEKYIRRTPFGYVCEVGLTTPGDKTSEIIYNDSDNDGLWTSMYGAGECFAYAATKDPKAKDRAKRAFEALRFLQKVTQDCEHSPPKGYVARTIRSVDLPDPNEGRFERDKKERETGDYLWKAYEPRWPKSADGKWYWKSDTSSDELDGHYFFYPLYYDLVAETEEEKERVREVVRDLTDHLVDHGYYLIDHDGTPTRWSIYGPDSLNHDHNWWEERGLKSISMLSYLAVAEHMTGDPKYRKCLNELREKHAYDTNAMIYKIHRGIGSGNQSDDEMAFMSYYNLVKYANDDKLFREMLYSFYSAWVIEQPEMNPFFNFCYAAFGIGGTYVNPWGTYPIDPWDGWLEDSMATLTGFPLDRINWRCENSHRLDILPLPRQQAVAPMEPPRGGKGYRVNGKVIPVENRHFNHWNSNPWDLNTGGSGNQLANGTVFLLPYYMGLYHGFIEETR
jgi:Two component regulator propeller